MHIRGSADAVNKAKVMIENVITGKAQKDILLAVSKSLGRSTPSSSLSSRSATGGNSGNNSSRSRRNGNDAAQTNVANSTATTPTPTVAYKATSYSKNGESSS